MTATETRPTTRGELYNCRTTTPWGRSDMAQDYGLGIICYCTPSHGGFFVPRNLLHRISQEGRDHARRWSRDERYYEEDCSWAYVAISFPELFTDSEIENAHKTIEWLKRDK